MKKLSPIVVQVVHLPLPDPREQSGYAQRLLVLANAWLQRRLAGHVDALLLLGIGNCTEKEFRSKLTPFGLGEAAVALIESADGDLDQDSGERVAEFLDGYLARSHPGAIPLGAWPKQFRDMGYPDDAWWLGLEVAKADSGPWAACIAALTPSPFQEQAATWEAVLDTVTDLDSEGGPTQRMQAGLAVASSARWLSGFSAAAGDTFFSFDYSDVEESCELDPFLLGFEAAVHHRDEVESAVEEFGEGDLSRFAVKELLASGQYLSTADIRSFFGGSAMLFFSLYTSIWPKRRLPAGEACEDLCSPGEEDMGEIDDPWRFITHNDWEPIDDSL